MVEFSRKTTWTWFLNIMTLFIYGEMNYYLLLYYFNRYKSIQIIYSVSLDIFFFCFWILLLLFLLWGDGCKGDILDAVLGDHSFSGIKPRTTAYFCTISHTHLLTLGGGVERDWSTPCCVQKLFLAGIRNDFWWSSGDHMWCRSILARQVP